jgi:flagellar protein FliS
MNRMNPQAKPQTFPQPPQRPVPAVAPVPRSPARPVAPAGPQVNAQAQNYLRTRVMTATPEQLQMMLYDGAVRFAEQARVALEKKDYETSYSLLSRTQKIVSELSGSLKPSVAPELCGKLAGLYNFVFRKLVEANVSRDIPALDEALKVLRYQRETWSLLMEELAKQKATTAASKLDLPAPSARMEAAISVKG